MLRQALKASVRRGWATTGSRVFRFASSLPPHKLMPMPSLSPTMEVGSIAKWSVKEGDKFEAGQALAEVETDKATVTLDATDEGYVAKILVGTGEIKVGQPIMVTVDEQGDIAAFANFAAAPAPVAAVAPKAAAPPAPIAAPKAPAPAPAPSPAPVPAASRPASALPTSTLPLAAVSSVRWSGGKASRGALATKLAMDQQKYQQRWGFTGFTHDAASLPKAKK